MTQAVSRWRLGPGGRFLSLVAAFVAVVAGIGIVQSIRHYDATRDIAVRDARSRATVTANSVDAFLEAHLQTLAVLGRSAVAVGPAGPRPTGAFAAVTPREAGFDGGIMLLDRSGRPRATALPLPAVERAWRSLDLRREPWFARVLAGEPNQVSAVMLPLATAAPVLVLAVALNGPDGAVAGVLAGVIRLGALQPARLTDGSLVIVDARDRVLYRDGPVPRLSGTPEGSTVARLRARSGGVETGVVGLYGDGDRLLSYESVPRAGWLVVLERPMSDVIASASRNLVSDLGWILGGSILSLLGAAWAARRIGKAADDAERARLRAHRMRLILEAALGRHAIDDLLDGVLQALRRVFAADTATVLLLDPDGRSLRPRVSVGLPAPLDEQGVVPVGEGFAGRVLEEGAPIVVDDVEQADLAGTHDEDRIGTLAGVPLVADGEAFGVLHVGTRDQRNWTAEEIGLLEAAASRVAVAIALARLREEEQGARLRAETLAQTADALGRARTAVDVARIVRDVVAPLVGATVASVSLLDRERDELAVLRPTALEDVDNGMVAIPVGVPAPPVDALVRRSPVCASSRDELADRYPHLDPDGLYPAAQAIAELPLLVDGEAIGVLSLGFAGERPFSADDRAFLMSLAKQCAEALDLARLYEREHEVAFELQQSLLVRRTGPLEGLRVAVRYLAGTEGLRVGGDWHDVIDLGGGHVGLVVGDVVGRGVRAAAAMGQLRSGLAALAPTSSGPAELLTKLDAFAESVPDAAFATVSYAEADLASGRVRYASAGHPPPVLMRADGSVTLLEDGRSQPLCAAFGQPREEAVCILEEGAKLLLYSDGLVERRGSALDQRFDLLVEVSEAHHELDPEALCDAVLESMDAVERGDDVALLCLERLPRGVRRFATVVPASPSALAPLRREVRSWLRSVGVHEDTALDLLLALGEAVSNAVEHAYVSAKDGDIGVEIELEEGRLLVAVRDTGLWRPPQPANDRGRGLAIIGMLVDDLHLDRGDGGSTIRMLKEVAVEAQVSGNVAG